MAAFVNNSQLAATPSATLDPTSIFAAATTAGGAVIAATVAPPPGMPFYKTATLSPGHAAILEMHANSQSNALIYVVVVLALYILGMTIVVIKYIRTERYEARLTRLFHNLVQRDRFFRVSRRRSSLPKDIPAAPSAFLDEDLPLSPVIQLHGPNGEQVEVESKM